MKIANPVRDVRTIKQLLEGAEAEADRAGEPQAGAEHLLLSALDLPDGSARRAFERVGADPDGVRDAIAAQHADALRGIGVEPPEDEALDAAVAAAPAPKKAGAFRSTASARSAFQEAGALARGQKGVRLAGAHVVIAVAGQRHGTAARALKAMGVEGAALAAAAREEVGLEG